MTDSILPKISNFSYSEPNASFITYGETTFKTPALAALQKYGIERSVAIYMVQNHWNIKQDFRDILSAYYILFWDRQWFFDHLINGAIEREGVTYQVIFYNCTAHSLRQLCDSTVRISFRALQPEYGFHSVALVTHV